MSRISLFLSFCGVVLAQFECFDQSNAPDMFKNCGGDRYAGVPFGTRSPVLSQHGMAATSHPLATEIAMDILKGGGNAVDAAIAANAAQTLMEPSSCGVGGDLFAIVWDPKTERLYGLNGSGRSSKTQSFTDLAAKINNSPYLPSRGPHSISVPGTVSGWFELHRRFGQLSMAETLQQTIDYAEEGYPMAEVVGTTMATTMAQLMSDEVQRDITDNGKYPDNFQEWLDTYAASGSTPAPGEIFRNPNYAETLRAIAREDGDDVFYRGEIAQRIAQWAPSAGVALTFDDFSTHTATWVGTMNVTYRGWEVHELPPNGQGIAALQMLNILEGFDLASMGHNSADYLHVHLAAKQLAYADRARFYADPDFNNLDYEALLTKEYAAERRQLIDMENAFTFVGAGNVYPNLPQLEHGDTIYLSVADENGMMVSLIQSLYSGFGSGLVPPGLGFPLQNRGALFSMFPGLYNAYEPNKRPFHTIIPAFVTKEGKPVMSFGLMGGAMQAQGHAQIITNMVDFGLNVQEAGDAARYYHTGSSEPTGYIMTDGGVTALESGISGRTREELESRGHVLGTSASYGGHQAILWDEENQVYWGASEMRKDGLAAGY